MFPVFGLAMVATCLGCYSNWFLKRVDGYLWRWKPWSLSIFAICHMPHIVNSHLVFNQWVSTTLILTMLRCCFWSPIILLVCVARQVSLSLAQIWSEKNMFCLPPGDKKYVSSGQIWDMLSQIWSEKTQFLPPTRWPRASCQELLVQQLCPVKL